ncbi:hypothetical protein FRB90_006676, partial [Tulasnella sp. 427]
LHSRFIVEDLRGDIPNVNARFASVLEFGLGVNPTPLLYIFGGEPDVDGLEASVNNDFYKLNVDKLKWKDLNK